MGRSVASEDEFDYVVVGAGSAGCALASRLSERPSTRVALVEAGGWDRDPWIHVPVGYYRTAFSEKLTWGYVTEPDPGLGGRANPWPRAKVVGGCSSINGLVYIRGQAEDFRAWRQQGCPGWDWEDMLPIFRRMEDQERGEDDLHGTEGPLGVIDMRVRSRLMDAYIDAAMQAGLPRNDDFNGPKQEGVGRYQLTVRGRRRCSAAAAYLKPALKRANLRVVTEAQAERVLLDGRRAVGVRLRRAGQSLTLRARREVILSAGAIGSPHILELSGIGDPGALKAAGIAPVVANLGVGENLQDHLQVKTVFLSRRKETINDAMRDPVRLVKAGIDYAVFGRGLLTVGAAQVGVFARVTPGVATPDVQFHVMPGSTSDPRKGMDPFSAFTATICQLRPESRGNLHAVSPDASVQPRIVANYLSAESDRRTVIEGLRLSRRIAGQPALADWVAAEKYPGPDVQSDEELLDWARKVGTTIYHPSGTCRMGSDEAAVVDPQLRVRGVEGLRVADASIMPTLISGNTNAACMAIGERLADMMREETTHA